jgi:hypothetical protein
MHTYSCSSKEPRQKERLGAQISHKSNSLDDFNIQTLFEDDAQVHGLTLGLPGQVCASMYACITCMYVCMYVCMYIGMLCVYACITCMYVCIYVCMYVCMYRHSLKMMRRCMGSRWAGRDMSVCVCMYHLYVRICMYDIYVYVCMYVCIKVYCAYMHELHMYVCMYVCMYVRTYLCTESL